MKEVTGCRAEYGDIDNQK